jgi:hypothetical protein
MSYTWTDLIGNLGVALVILAYLGLQLERLDARGLAYSVANATGAAMILVSLSRDFNLSAVAIEAFWVGISLLGIWRWHRRRQA